MIIIGLEINKIVTAIAAIGLIQNTSGRRRRKQKVGQKDEKVQEHIRVNHENGMADEIIHEQIKREQN